MLRLTQCLFMLAVVPSLALAQATPPPAVKGNRIDPVKADPMPQGIKDLLVFRGAPAEWRPPPVVARNTAPKGLSSADKLALVRSAASKSGLPASGASMAPYVSLTIARLAVEGRASLGFSDVTSLSSANLFVSARPSGYAQLLVTPEAAGRLYLIELAATGAGRTITCTMRGSGGSSQTFRLSPAGDIVPAVFEAASTATHLFQIECDGVWNFWQVDVSVLR